MKSERMEAIDTQKVVELRHHGYARTVEPHAYGRDKNGGEIIGAFKYLAAARAVNEQAGNY
ncbi:MAG: hypothetical protein ACKVQA_24975 [Burkholderiales bacterium]